MFTIKKDGYNYKFEILYKKGGHNYFYDKYEPRGYRLSVKKYKIENGFKKVVPQDSDNMLIFIKIK